MERRSPSQRDSSERIAHSLQNLAWNANGKLYTCSVKNCWYASIAALRKNVIAPRTPRSDLIYPLMSIMIFPLPSRRRRRPRGKKVSIIIHAWRLLVPWTLCSRESHGTGGTMENMSSTRRKMKTKMVPPDGGWGWVVLFSALVVNFLIPGTVKSFGVLFVEFLHVFKASSTAGSWMPALCYFLYSSLGKCDYSRLICWIGGAAFICTSFAIFLF